MSITANDEFLTRVDDLLADPLQVAHAAAGTGTRVIGYLGADVPQALIVAADALPLRLFGAARTPTPRADAILESAFSPVARAVTEQWLTGALDGIDSVVFSRADDSSQRLYYYLCELQRRGRCGGPRPLLYDIARIGRTTSIDHSRASTRQLAAELNVTPDALPRALQRVARRQSLLRELRARQVEQPLAGSTAWRVTRAATHDWRDTFDDALQRWLATAPARPAGRRILLAGNATPDAELQLAIEAAGGSVVAECTESLPAVVREDPDAIAAIADSICAARNPVLAMREDADWAVARVREARADAVVFWLMEEDESLPWEIARQLAGLRQQRIPALLLARQTAAPEAKARQQVMDFVNALEVPT